ncbi:MAG: LacI family transcriptional regulator [Erysipelothrix sp.]|nr:LacI family transcriptional regulator [Erysipelothrix sp.]
MVDIRDIARLAGVSTATVSKVLNNYTEVSDATKARVLRIVEEVGYIPNSSARALSTKRTWLIGIVYSEHLHIGLEHNYFSGVLEAFKSEVECLGYDIVFISGKDIGYLKRCQVRNVDGVFVVTADMMDTGLTELFDSKIKCVTTDVPYKAIPLVYSDNRQGSILAVDHLIQLGHRRIAHIAGPLTTIAGQERLDGYRQGLANGGIDYDESLVIEAAEYDSKSGYECMKRLLNLPQRPTAVYVMCDLTALGVIHAINECGLKVGEDISVVGFDDIELASHIHPTLTTIRQDRRRIGKMLALTLHRMINHEDVQERTIINTSLVVRQSTKPICEE